MKNIKTYRESLMERDEQEELNADLIYAVRMDRREQVKDLLKRGADVDFMRDGDTPLSCAAQKGHVEIMKDLLEAGADPNLGAARYHTLRVAPLCIAVSSGESKSIYPMMKLLLEAGADPNGRNARGRTALSILAFENNGSWEMYELLFRHGADANIPDSEGRVPLYWPFKYMTGDDVDIAKILMLNGADPFKAVDDVQMIFGLFDGDLDWMPEGPIKTKLKRMQRGKSAFGM